MRGHRTTLSDGIWDRAIEWLKKNQDKDGTPFLWLIDLLLEKDYAYSLSIVESPTFRASLSRTKTPLEANL